MAYFVDKVITGPFERLFERLADYVPNILTSLLILTTGILIGILLRHVFVRLMRAVKIDRVTERSGVVGVLRKGGVREPLSSLLARLIEWLVIAVFAILSLWALNLPSSDIVLERFFLYLPNLVVALIILFFGYSIGNFMGRTALIAAVNAGIKMSGTLAKAVKASVFLMALAMALEQLGIARNTILIAFTILFGGIVFALGLAFGLGGRHAAREFIERKLREERKEDELHHV